MAVARHYILHAGAGKEDQLLKALEVLAVSVRSVEGNEGVEVLRDVADGCRLIFLERWVSMEAHKKGAAHIPKAAFAPVMAALDGPPLSSTLEYVPVDAWTALPE